MAPTICEDRDGSSDKRPRLRVIKHRNSSVISYVGRKATARHSVATSRGGTPTEVDTRKSENERDEQSVMSEHQGREHKTNTDDDDSSMDSCSQNSLLFHNYSKRCNDEQKTDDIDTTRVCPSNSSSEDESLAPSTPATSTSSLYEDLSCTRRGPFVPYRTTTLPSSSPLSMPSPSQSPSVLLYRFATPPTSVPPSPAQNRGLLDIAVKTVKLLQKNRLLQARLEQLQTETREFIKSVMANPENAELRKRIQFDGGKEDKCNQRPISLAMSY